MKHKLRQIAYMIASLSIVFGLAAMPASALGKESNPIERTDDSTSSSQTKAVNTNDDNSSDAVEPSDSLRSQARQLLQAKRENIKEHTLAMRQKACQQRQKGIDTRTKAYGTAAERHLTMFNQIFTKVQAFHDSKKLNVANYDALVTAAKDKQATAQSAVDALKALDVQIDCTQSDPATAVATIKQAVANARTALQAYRTALKDVIAALKGAATATPSNATDKTTGGAQ
ncbi:MAG TPA: hypothetical protein VLG92_04060 [Candidatus Saccharimonadia bacterium]|nr:hypothetical protein [Candidatus Saccharimonadia bacterium]